MPRDSIVTTCAALAALLLSASSAAAADSLLLTNGDTLTGQLRSVTSSAVVFASDLAGTVTIKRTAVTRLTRSGSDGRVQAVAPGDLESLARDGDRSQAPAWSGAANGDLAMNRGNSDTATVSINGTAARIGQGEKLATYGTYLVSTVGAGFGTTLARAARGGARYDRDIARPLYAFGFGDVEHDFLQLLDLRTVVGGGAGIHVANSHRVQANLFGGVSYARDRYAAPIPDPTATGTATTTTTTTTTTPANAANANAAANPTGKGLAIGRNRIITVEGRTPPQLVNTTLTRAVGEYVAGQDLIAQLSDTMTLTQRFVLFPAINDPGDYRISFDLSLTGQISERWQWHSTVADRYLRIPPSGGAVRNDLFIASGIGVTFGSGDVGGYRGADARR